MGGLPCYKQIINSREAQQYLAFVEQMSQDVFDGKVDDFFYEHTNEIIFALDEITNKSREVFLLMEKLLREHFSEA